MKYKSFLFVLLVLCLLGIQTGCSTRTTQAPPAFQATAAMPLQGPGPFPTPGKEAISLAEYIDQKWINEIEWQDHRGELTNPVDQSNREFQLKYPQDWWLEPNASPTRFTLQNVTEISSAPGSVFVKFDMLYLSQTPILPEDEIFIPTDFQTIDMPGKPGVLYIHIEEPEQRLNITLLQQQDVGWLLCAGFIFVPQEDASTLDKYQSILLNIINSLTINP